jgi:hypothetical protein
MFGLNREELAILRPLSSPIKIQDFLDGLPRNMEKDGDTCMSPRAALKAGKAHCIEGAFLAATALWLHGRPPLLFDLRANPDDLDHVVALYRQNGHWGAISKTNYVTLRFRDPVYRNLRELALSYFHEYIDERGRKSLIEFSARPFDLSRLGESWVTRLDSLEDIAEALDQTPHMCLVPKQNKRFIRPADKMEMAAQRIKEWDPADPRT